MTKRYRHIDWTDPSQRATFSKSSHSRLQLNTPSKELELRPRVSPTFSIFSERERERKRGEGGGACNSFDQRIEQSIAIVTGEFGKILIIPRRLKYRQAHT